VSPEDFAALHARAFGATAWSAAEFTALMSSALVFALGDARAAALGRAVADEAELLTIATDPDHRRTGLARARLAAFETEARHRGAHRAFLEVGAENPAAQHLYRAAGWTEIGRRAGYYARKGNGTEDAILMEKSLSRR
jgi:ribosomal-protein-alanine N-acetyltransferase